MMRKLRVIGSFVALAASSAVWAYSEAISPENYEKYIIHGAKKSTITENVNTVGGDVIREFTVIDGVSARLSESQLTELKTLNPMLRPFKDSVFKVSKNKKASKKLSFSSFSTKLDSASHVAGKLSFDIASNEAIWTFASDANSDSAISEITMQFPTGKSDLQSLKLNDVLFDFSQKGNVYSLSEPVFAASQGPVTLVAKFSELSSADSDDYSLQVAYSNRETVTVQVPDNSNEYGSERDTHYPTLVNANLAHQNGLTGHGVTVAILDTGIRDLTEIKKTATSGDRDITIVDVLNPSISRGQAKRNDANGHGTHLASIITNSSESVDESGDKTGSFNGIAPDVNLVVVKAFDENGQSSYGAILDAIDYVVENKNVLNIKVLNLSFSTTPSSFYWEDPVNQALMKAWNAGITVVAAAGNTGPDPMTIGVPGNSPYVITVGAISDNYTPSNQNDDFVTSFSSAGPTVEGFVKPELVAPGGHIVGVMDKQTLMRDVYSLFLEKDSASHDYFALSGTSQATAVTSGIVALMLQANPDLAPDDIKCRLIQTARAATNSDGQLAYSVFQQGAGLVDAMAAIESTAMGCGNTGLSIEKELAGEAHFFGPVSFDESSSEFYVIGSEELRWNGVYTDAQLWRTDAQLWRTDAQLWRTDAQLWRTDAQLWRTDAFGTDAQLWRTDAQLWRTDAQLWRTDAQLWRTDAQLWRTDNFNTDSIIREWVNHE